jgi:hypothetical protein
MRGYEGKAREKAGVELRKADDNWTTVTQLLAEAKAKCSTGGFKAFKEKFCPDLSRSRIYELLQIGDGTKNLEESRAETRKRVGRHRRGKVSVTNDVTDKGNADSGPEGQMPAETTTNVEPEAKPAVPGNPFISAIGKAEYAGDDFGPGLGGYKPGCAPDWLRSAIEHELLEAERAFEVLTSHGPARVAEVIDPSKVALITEIANWFLDLKAVLTACSGANGEAPVAGPDVARPSDQTLRRRGRVQQKTCRDGPHRTAFESGGR